MASTISDSGTWTAITTDLTSHVAGNVPSINNEQYADFKTPISEVDQFIVLMMTAYSCTYWQAASFLRQQLNSIFRIGDVPRTGASDAA